MDTKNKPGQKGGESRTKNPTRPEPIQTRVGTSMERSQSERQQPDIPEQHKQKQGQKKGGRK